MKSKVSNDQLREIRVALGGNPQAWKISDEIKKRYGETLHESTIRGRFLEMNEPLSGQGGPRTGRSSPTQSKPTQVEILTKRASLTDVIAPRQYQIGNGLELYIPDPNDFGYYIERPVDSRLALHYALGKHPLTQGKQGTGKTQCHRYYGMRHKLPFFLYSMYSDFKLRKLFGDKTIENGSIKFKESLFVKAIQGPSVIVFDEVNAISNENSFDFHALLQDRELFVKDADDGKGKVYKLHPECKIGFAQNPKSAKYIGGNIKPSNFLGRCTFITFPEFTKTEIATAIKKRFPAMQKADVEKFTKFYFACIQAIASNNLNVDISIRQLMNVIDLWINGLPLGEAIEDGLSSMLEAVSQPQAKDSFHALAAAIWKELM